MSSHLPYANRLIYHIQTKLSCEVPDHLKADILYALYDYGEEASRVAAKERDYWKNRTLKERDQ